MNSSQATHTPVNRQKTVRFLSLLLCLPMLVGGVAELVACGTGDTAETTSTGGETNSEPEVTAEEDPFKNVDYKGREFRILTSTNIASAGMGNSNYLIEGEKDAASSMVNDAVFERNAVVEKKIGVQLKFTQLDVDYNGVFSKIRTYVANNLDEYDLVINDLFPFANLSIEGNFRNILAPEFTGFDFEDKTTGTRSTWTTCACRTGMSTFWRVTSSSTCSVPRTCSCSTRGCIRITISATPTRSTIGY